MVVVLWLGALQEEGEEGTAVSVVPQQTVLPEWTSLSLILSTRASTHRVSLILCGYVWSIFYVVCGLNNLYTSLLLLCVTNTAEDL